MIAPEIRTTAYVDILGFSDRLAQAEQRAELLVSIHRALYSVRQKESEIYAPLPEQPLPICQASLQTPSEVFGYPTQRTTEMSAMSDCFAISDAGPLAYTVIARSQELAFKLLESEGFLCRGGIVEDAFYHQDGVAFGPALIRAHDLEARVANYPRILVDEALATRYFAWEGQLDQHVRSPPAARSRLRGLRYPRLLARSDDGCHFVNLFVPIPDLIPGGWQLDGDVWPKRFRIVRERLVERLDEAQAKSKPNPNHLAKIRWLVNQFNINVETEDFRSRVAAIPRIPV